MSHAKVVVALSAADVKAHGVDGALAAQMQPFDENGQWFAEGSRWDWYVIGGRYRGGLAGRDVVLRRDLTVEACSAYAKQRALECWQAAEASCKGMGEQEALATRGFLYGLLPGDTLADLTKRYAKKPLMAYAFLRDHCWHERGRLGWFGGEVSAETDTPPGEAVALPRVLHEAQGAKVLSWSNPALSADDDEAAWGAEFWARFLADLPGDTTVVCVDYHV